jgi:hypothetical protein
MRLNPGQYALAIALLLIAVGFAGAAERQPPPPQIPENFVGRGRYLVPDLDVNVPFRWEGQNGNVQMIAGSPRARDPIYFQNIIYKNAFGETDLYTITYKWPLPIPNPGTCSKIRFGDQGIDLETVNAFFSGASFVGREILVDKTDPVNVNHFRVSFVVPVAIDLLPPYPFVFRFPVLSADLYVDPKNPEIFRKVLHFGLQNIYDPDLDEWFEMSSFKFREGLVILPKECERVVTVDSVLELGAVK